MKICFVSDYYPSQPHFGGIAVYTRRIALALSRRGHEVHVVVAKGGGESEMEDGPVHVHMRQVRWLPVLGRWLPGLGESLGIARTLQALNARHGFDAVEIPNWEGLGLASVRLAGLRVAIRLHTSLAESVEMAGRRPTQAERFMIWAEMTSARRARAVVTHSEAHRQRMAAAYKLGLDRIEVIPHGIPIPARYGPPEGRTVLSIGRMNPRKGMETLFAAIPEILRRVPDARFKIVGVSSEHEAIRGLQERHPGRVEALKGLSGEELQGLYRECALYVSPATYESFGLTFVEAMAEGRPVVGCAASAIPEIVRHGVDGLLVPPRDDGALAEAVAALLADEGIRLTMGRNARQRAEENFSIERCAERVERFFMDVREA